MLPRVDRILIAMALARLATGRAARASLVVALARQTTEPGALDALARQQPAVEWQRAMISAHKDRIWIDGVDGFVLVFGTAEYPSALADIPDPPAVLYGLGNPAAFEGLCVAIVGSRQGTNDGCASASDLAADLTTAGICIVSGLARGIDASAHRAALAAGGRTVAVLGAGLDHMYPAEHAGLARAICAIGAVISEFPPGTRPYPAHFPQRNRVISGLSAGVVLIEAGEKSGSLSTARQALDQGREVMVVPGSVRTPRNRGGHQMIKHGAALVENALDVLEVLGLPAPETIAGAAVAANRGSERAPPEDPLGGAIYAALGNDPATMNELIDRVQRSVAEVGAALVALEVGGFVQLVGQRYSRAS